MCTFTSFFFILFFFIAIYVVIVWVRVGFVLIKSVLGVLPNQPQQQSLSSLLNIDSCGFYFMISPFPFLMLTNSAEQPRTIFAIPELD